MTGEGDSDEEGEWLQEYQDKMNKNRFMQISENAKVDVVNNLIIITDEHG